MASEHALAPASDLRCSAQLLRGQPCKLCEKQWHVCKSVSKSHMRAARKIEISSSP